ncbi:MAG: hypothetical protein FWG80_04420 [Alphaproteobacteria bacterium]|nr:hypothetical protein [Alphaproteobacteria bacterium]
MNTFNKTIKITSILAVLTIIPLHDSIAAVACMARPISPTSCNSVGQCPAGGTIGDPWNQDCNNLSLGDWRVSSCTGSNVSEFSGTSLCSSTNGGDMGNFGNPIADDGSNCWCKITSIPGFSVASSAWVFLLVLGSQSSCANNCAGDCAAHALLNPVLRSPLFAALGL